MATVVLPLPCWPMQKQCFFFPELRGDGYGRGGLLAEQGAGEQGQPAAHFLVLGGHGVDAGTVSFLDGLVNAVLSGGEESGQVVGVLGYDRDVPVAEVHDADLGREALLCGDGALFRVVCGVDQLLFGTALDDYGVQYALSVVERDVVHLSVGGQLADVAPAQRFEGFERGLLEPGRDEPADRFRVEGGLPVGGLHDGLGVELYLGDAGFLACSLRRQADCVLAVVRFLKAGGQGLGAGFVAGVCQQLLCCPGAGQLHVQFLFPLGEDHRLPELPVFGVGHPESGYVPVVGRQAPGGVGNDVLGNDQHEQAAGLEGRGGDVEEVGFQPAVLVLVVVVVRRVEQQRVVGGVGNAALLNGSRHCRVQGLRRGPGPFRVGLDAVGADRYAVFRVPAVICDLLRQPSGQALDGGSVAAAGVQHVDAGLPRGVGGAGVDSLAQFPGGGEQDHLGDFPAGLCGGGVVSEFAESFRSHASFLLTG